MDQPKTAGNLPLPAELEQGKQYFWCSCGQSKNQPFCDGSHSGTGFTPVSFEAEKTATAYLCTCKRTANAPYCDGAHSKLPKS